MKTLLAMVLVVVVVGSADAQKLYRYMDENGEFHVTDDPNKIPYKIDPTEPPRQLKNENLWVPLPTGFKIAYQARKGNKQLTEAVPRAETVQNWTEMVSYSVNFGMKNTDLEKLRTGMKEGNEAICKSTYHHLVHSGKERGYPVSVFLLFCHLNPATGKPEYTFFKALQGNDSLYIVWKALKFEPNGEQTVAAMEFLKRVAVCDSRLPDRACPTVTRD